MMYSYLDKQRAVAKAALMRLIASDHLSMLFNECFEFIMGGSMSEYARFETEAMERMRSISKKRFLLGAVAPIFLYIFLVLTFSNTARVLLSKLWERYNIASEMYGIAVAHGCADAGPALNNHPLMRTCLVEYDDRCVNFINMNSSC